jgi:hypothetical protein
MPLSNSEIFVYILPTLWSISLFFSRYAIIKLLERIVAKKRENCKKIVKLAYDACDVNQYMDFN